MISINPSEPDRNANHSLTGSQPINPSEQADTPISQHYMPRTAAGRLTDTNRIVLPRLDAAADAVAAMMLHLRWWTP